MAVSVLGGVVPWLLQCEEECGWLLLPCDKGVWLAASARRRSVAGCFSEEEECGWLLQRGGGVWLAASARRRRGKAGYFCSNNKII